MAGGAKPKRPKRRRKKNSWYFCFFVLLLSTSPGERNISGAFIKHFYGCGSNCSKHYCYWYFYCRTVELLFHFKSKKFCDIFYLAFCVDWFCCDGARRQGGTEPFKNRTKKIIIFDLVPRNGTGHMQPSRPPPTVNWTNSICETKATKIGEPRRDPFCVNYD